MPVTQTVRFPAAWLLMARGSGTTGTPARQVAPGLAVLVAVAGQRHQEEQHQRDRERQQDGRCRVSLGVDLEDADEEPGPELPEHGCPTVREPSNGTRCRGLRLPLVPGAGVVGWALMTACGGPA